MKVKVKVKLKVKLKVKVVGITVGITGGIIYCRGCAGVSSDSSAKNSSTKNFKSRV